MKIIINIIVINDKNLVESDGDSIDYDLYQVDSAGDPVIFTPRGDDDDVTPGDTESDRDTGIAKFWRPQDDGRPFLVDFFLFFIFPSLQARENLPH